jgi:hypothetical protein
LLVCSLFAAIAVPPAAGDEAIEFFENHIRPVLVESCYGCHCSEQGDVQGEFALDNRASLLAGGKNGPVVVAGKPDESRLLTALRYHDPALQMPPDGKLPDEVIEQFAKWIAIGAPDPRDGAAVELDTIANRAARHWAFQRPVAPALPADETGWSQRPLDQLVLAKLRQQQLQPAPQADRRVLIERLYFDLIGLPPSCDEVAQFVADDSSDAYAKLVEQLLARPAFGERWGRHWLDVARYADTKGYVFQEDRNYPGAYKYRDWVIAAFNDDMPIDRFMMYQIAADQLAEGEGDQHHLAASGFLTLGRRFLNNRHDIIADQIDVLYRGLTGVTVACARCHDHKFDPVSIEDYYATYGVLVSAREEQPADMPLRLVEKEHAENVGVFLRGNDRNRGPIVPRGVPAMFAGEQYQVDSGSGRLQLAESIASADNPLTARVFVNRVWMHLTGRPLVDTPSDFGLRAEAPPHQELLDHLAVAFVNHGWSLKWLIREIVASSSYQLSSVASDQLATADPDNIWLGRANRRRRDFESLRDTVLAVSGRLDPQLGGASENIDTPTGGVRRTVYAHIDRQNLPGVFRTFDFASPDAHSPRRLETLVPQQSLFMLNAPLVQLAAEALAQRNAGDDSDARIDALYRAILRREPNAEERQLASAFLGNRQSLAVEESPWSYGFGQVTDHQGAARVEFTPLTKFVENRWQPTDEFPDSKFGYLMLTAAAGHPGNGRQQATIRRWRSPVAGQVRIDGQLRRASDQGDGVVAQVISSSLGTLGTWHLVTGQQTTEVVEVCVAEGDLIDFVVSNNKNPAFDSFEWPVTIKLLAPQGAGGAGGDRWSSERDFAGPSADPLGVWAQLAQVLLASSEFMYVD